MSRAMIANLTLIEVEEIDNFTETYQSPRSLEVSTVVRLTITTCVFVLTLVGNVIAIYFVSKKKDLLGLKNYYYGYYLINLSVSDILVAILCIPFTVIYYESQHWPLGSAMCKIMPTLQITAVTTSIGTLVVITFDRYQSIIHPMRPRASSLGIKIKIVCVWIWAFTVGAPSLYANEYNPDLKRYQCQEVWTKKQYRQVYTIIILLFDYLLPLAIISVLYTRIIFRLRGETFAPRSDEARNLHRRFLRLTALLVTSFAICYLPAKVCFLVMDFGTISNQRVFTTVLNYSHVLIWFNSCLNPFIYGTVYGFFKARVKRNISMFFTTIQNKSVVEPLSKGKYVQYITIHDNDYHVPIPKENEFKCAQESVV